MNAAFLKRHLTTIVLVILAIVGVVVLFVVDKGNVTTQESERRAKNVVPQWRLEDITEITLTTHGKTARLTLGPPTAAGQRLWEVTLDGGHFVASQQSVDQLLGTLEYATFERKVSRDAVAEGELGLKEPATVVTVTMGPKTYRVSVGGLAPSPKDARYCDVDGQVYVITAQLASALDMRPEALRTRTFVPYLSTDLKGLSVDGEGGARHFARAAWSGSRGAGFRFDGTTPEGSVRANAEAIDRLLGAIGSMQAESFLADDEADKAIQRRFTITMLPKNEREPKAVIEIGGACPGKEDQVVAVRREPTRSSACVPDTVIETLAKPTADYVDRSIVGARSDEVNEIRIAEGAREIEIARSGTGWHMRKPSDRKVGAEAGNALVDAITSLDAAKIVTGDPKELGLDPPAATLKITSSAPVFGGDGGASERVETVEIGAPKGDVVRARRAEDGAILELPADKVHVLTPSEVVLRDAAVLEIDRADLRELTIVAASPQGARTQKFKRAEAVWTLAEPKIEGISADTGLVEDVANALVGLKAVRWVAPKDDGSFGLEKPRLAIEAKLAASENAKEKTVRVEIGAPTQDGVFARTSDDPAVFVAPVALEQTAGLWLLDRQALVVDPAAIARVEASTPGGKKIAAERSGDVWKPSSNDGAAGRDADAAVTLRNAVAGLIAEGVVGIGAPDRTTGLDKPRLVLTIVADPEQGAPKGAPKRTTKVSFGAGDSFRGTSVVYARREGLDVTFAIAQGRVRALFDAAGVK